MFKGRNIVCGNFKVTTTEYNRKTYNVPKEIKEQYEDVLLVQCVNIKNMIEAL